MSGGPGQRAPLLSVPEEPPLISDGLCADVRQPQCCRVGPGWLRQDHRSRWQINEEGHLTTFVIVIQLPSVLRGSCSGGGVQKAEEFVLGKDTNN